MFVDSKLQLADGQAFTASGGTTNVVDLGSDRDLGRGEPMCMLVSVTATADATTGDETYQFEVETDDNEAFSSASKVVLVPVDKALLVEGYSFFVPLPKTNERYLRGYLTLGGTTPSVSIDAFVQPQNMVDTAADIKYPDGFDIT